MQEVRNTHAEVKPCIKSYTHTSLKLKHGAMYRLVVMGGICSAELAAIAWQQHDGGPPAAWASTLQRDNYA